MAHMKVELQTRLFAVLQKPIWYGTVSAISVVSDYQID